MFAPPLVSLVRKEKVMAENENKIILLTMADNYPLTNKPNQLWTSDHTKATHIFEI